MMLAVGAVAATSSPAAAYAPPPGVEKDFACKTLDWRGQMKAGLNVDKSAGKPSVKGTVKVCAYLYQVTETSSKYDRYYVRVELRDFADVTNKLGKSYFTGKAGWEFRVKSNAATYGSDFGATKGFTYAKSTCGSISVGPNVPFITASYTFEPIVCNKIDIQRTEYNYMAAAWGNKNIRDIREVDFAFGQAVPAGMKPTYTVQLTVPYYEPVFTDSKTHPKLYWDLKMKGSAKMTEFTLSK